MSTEVRRNDGAGRYEMWVGGAMVGRAEFRDEGERIVFTHTEIDADREGQGLGGRLARAVLDDVAARGDQRIVPRCPFLAAYLARHPEYHPLVVDGFHLPVPD